MFPGPNAQVYYNEAGEPLGWDYPAEPEYCDNCGGTHSSHSCGALDYEPDNPCYNCEEETTPEDRWTFRHWREMHGRCWVRWFADDVQNAYGMFAGRYY